MSRIVANSRRNWSIDERLNDLSSRALLVNYLNASGRFWEYCNHASVNISDEQRPSVIAYIRGQKEHHKVVDFREEYISLMREFGLDPEEDRFLQDE